MQIIGQAALHHSDTLTSRQYTLNRLIWAVIAACAVIDAVWMVMSGITVDFSGTLPFAIGLAACAVLSLIYGYIRKDAPIWLLAQMAAQLMLSTPVLGALSYLAARAALPLIDRQLIALDHLLFFDWREYVTWLNHHPLLGGLLTFAYVSAGPQMLCILMLLFWHRQLLHIQRFTLLFIIGSLVAIVLASLLPSVGAYMHYDLNPAMLPHLHPAAALAHEDVLLGMRDHSLQVFTFPIKGIVSFPSFHTTVALLLIYASWPLPALRIITLPLNALVIASTLADGGHYLADILGGIAIALIGIGLAQENIRA